MAKTKKKKGKNWWKYLIAFVMVALIAGMLIQRSNYDKPAEVTLHEIKKRTIRETVGASGKIYPITEVKISSDVSGEIIELSIEEGDSVKTGQILAKIDPDAYESQVERARAGLNNSKANLAMSKSSLQNSKAQREQLLATLNNVRVIHERNRKLFNDGVISQAEFETSQTNLQAQEANVRAADASIEGAKQSIEGSAFGVQSAEATLKELRTSLRRTTIVAPMSGIVSSLSVEAGERVVGTVQMTGTEMMRIANLNAMEVQVDVSENDILRVNLADSAEIEVDAYFGQKFFGRVTQIANSAKNSGMGSIDQVTNFVVTIQINPSSYSTLLKEGREYPFRPGMSASVEVFTTTKTDVITVPIQAVTVRNKDDEEKKRQVNNEEDENSDELPEIDYENIDEIVFIFQGDTCHAQKVVTGIQDDEYIEILDGLSEGMKVIDGPYSLVSRTLENGDRVEEKSEDDKKKKKKKSKMN